ncbi:MAG: transposase, partial [Hyphomicrobium sp.]
VAYFYSATRQHCAAAPMAYFCTGGYIDAKNHLIVAHEVTNIGIDKGQLSSMAAMARDALKSGAVEVLADKGYYKSEEIAACDDAGIAVYVPKPITSNARAEGRFDKRDFVYNPAKDHYVCPAGQHLIHRATSEEKGQSIRVYWTTVCETCPLKRDCTTGKERRIRRWEREDVLERVQARLDSSPGMMRVRRETIEHTFGTLKAWMGATHFKMKTLKHVATEMALHVLAYNIKRVLAIVGIEKLLEAIAAFLSWLLGPQVALASPGDAIWHAPRRNRAKLHQLGALLGKSISSARSHTASYKSGPSWTAARAFIEHWKRSRFRRYRVGIDQRGTVHVVPHIPVRVQITSTARCLVRIEVDDSPHEICAQKLRHHPKL